jgi:hypothetical protein
MLNNYSRSMLKRQLAVGATAAHSPHRTKMISQTLSEKNSELHGRHADSFFAAAQSSHRDEVNRRVSKSQNRGSTEEEIGRQDQP